jgi:hypothetical protein
LHQDLQIALSRDDADVEKVQPALAQTRRSGVTPEDVSLEFGFRKIIEKWAVRWQASPDDVDCLQDMNRVLDVLDILPFQVNLWVAQNAAYEVVKTAGVRISEESARIALRLGVAAAQDLP